jgi:UDP-N-acetylglucosamine transferase subunit ALG13
VSRPQVLVTVGTDHHRFDRLVEWADAWAAAHPEADVFVQHGTADPPRHAAGAPTLAFRELKARTEAADVVVSHGGLSSIMERRAAGHLPLIVARDPQRGEHVDGHQQAFTSHEAAQGRVLLVDDEADLHAAIDRALVDPGHLALPPGANDVNPAVERVAALVDDLLGRRPAARPLQETPS